MQQVVGFLFVYGKVGTARHAKQYGAYDVEPHKKPPDMRQYDFFQ
jgi:hypothetical protein